MENDFSPNLLELLEMVEKVIPLNSIYLDPNNPRFALIREEIIPDSRITEKTIQAKSLNIIKEIGIKDIKDSIKKVGFLKIDRIVVRPIDDNNFVVVEGNRRVASLKEIKREYDDGEIKLDEVKLNSILKIEVLEYTGKAKDISWTVQGIRHISGIKNWPPYQQSKFLFKLIEEKGMRPSDISPIVGIGPRVAMQKIRSYYGYIQAEQHELYGPYIEPNMFSFFSEVIFKKPKLKLWLDWNDSNNKFENLENFSIFLSLICPDDYGNDPKIGRALDARDQLSEIIIYKDILENLIENEDFSLREAYGEAVRRDYAEIKKEQEEKIERDLLNIKMKQIQQMSETIINLPTVKIKSQQRKEFIDLLENLISNIKEQLKLLR